MTGLVTKLRAPACAYHECREIDGAGADTYPARRTRADFQEVIGDHDDGPPRAAFAAVGLCFGAIVFDGYDLIVYGSVVPALLHYEPWGLAAAEVGAIGSYALVGMFLGAIASGALTDLIGRRRLFIISLTWFSVMNLLAATAPTPELLGLFRFLAGLGFGGIPPTAIALVVEVAPIARRQVVNGLMLCGFPVGGVAAAVLAIVLLEPVGFRTLFAVGALPW